MERIGVRELRQHASKWLDRVKAGETITVCERGRPVAKLVPCETEDGIEALYASGVLRRPEADIRDLPPPLPLPPGARPPSEILQEMRDAERW